MDLIKNLFKRTVLIIVLISLLITFLATPASYAELKLEEDEFYYAGTTEGSYVPRFNIFSWLINNIGDIADWLLGIITMGFRMVFVGWTALLEKALTWALESTTGVSADGSLVESSTDLTGLTDSSNNITVEAIVYNKVAGLNIDFFELDFDRGTTGTGKRLVCQDCNKYVAEYEDEEQSGCISKETADDIRANAATIKEEIIKEGDNYNFAQYCSCSCNGCDSCSKYVKQLVADKPIVLKIRELVATWYSIIRFLAMAAMLVILIAIGIKMALSTIASDKAVYKRMLVDWVVGVIILFAIHYFMIFCIHMNGVVVKTIEDSAQSINKVQMQELFSDEEGISDGELEIKVYEEVRTRAYDARLINGMTGMIMYMTLVYFAFKYTLIYLKRYLTLLVLTLMGPAVGVAYALQKALSGKSSALSTWMKEYIMNVIIQIVHALLYAVFISQAMILSLQSIAGMVFALILMNYMAKADELFKKIFNFGGGDSLVGHTSNAMESSLQGLQTAKGLVTGAKPLANALTNSPYGKAVKGVGKLALAGTVAAGAGLGVAGKALGRKIFGESKNEQYDEAMDSATEEAMQTTKPEEGEAPEDYLKRVRDEARSKLASNPDFAKKFKNQIAMDTSREKLEKQVEDSKNALLEAQTDLRNGKEGASLEDISKKRHELIAAEDSLSRHDRKTSPTGAKIALGHAKRVFEINNEFNVRKKSDKNGKSVAWDNVKAVHDGIFGTVHWDRNSWKFTREKNAVFNQFSAENLFGMNAQDRKMFKEHVITPMMQGFIGMGSLFLGMGTIVANPKIGMGLLATGASLTNKTFKKPTNINSYKGTYTFSRFGLSTMNTIKNSAIAQARRERRGLTIADLDQRRPTFTQRLKDGDIKAITLGAVIAPVALPAYIATHPFKTTKTVIGGVFHPKRTVSNAVKYTGNVGKSVVKTGKQIGHAVAHPIETGKKAGKDVLEIAKIGGYAAVGAPKAAVRGFIENTSFAEHEEAMNRYNALEQEKRIKEFKKESDKLISIQAAAEIVALEKAEEERIKKELYEAAGYNYDPKTGLVTQKGEQTTETRKETKTVDLDTTVLQERVNDTRITEADVAMIDKELEVIIQELSSGKEIDCSSKAVQGEIIQKLNDKLIKSGLLNEGQSAEILFKRGESGLKSTIKKKAKRSNSTIKEASKNLESFLSREEVTAVANIVSQEINEQRATGETTVNVSVEKVLSKLNPSRDGSATVSTSDGSQNVSGNGDGSRSVRSNNTPQVTEKQRNDAIANFIQAVTPVATPAKPKEDLAKKKVIADVDREVKNRKKKLQQVMAIAMEVELDDQPISTSSQDTDSVVFQLLRGHGDKEIKAGSGTISLNATESEAATRMVKKLLEIKEANREAVQELDMKKGTKGYAKAKKKKSELTIQIHNLEQKRLQAEGGAPIELDNGYGGKTTYTDPNEAISAIDSLKAKKEAEKKKVEKEQKLAGPIYDINDLIKNQMGRR